MGAIDAASIKALEAEIVTRQSFFIKSRTYEIRSSTKGLDPYLTSPEISSNQDVVKDRHGK